METIYCKINFSSFQSPASYETFVNYSDNKCTAISHTLLRYHTLWESYQYKTVKKNCHHLQFRSYKIAIRLQLCGHIVNCLTITLFLAFSAPWVGWSTNCIYCIDGTFHWKHNKFPLVAHKSTTIGNFDGTKLLSLKLPTLAILMELFSKAEFWSRNCQNWQFRGHGFRYFLGLQFGDKVFRKTKRCNKNSQGWQFYGHFRSLFKRTIETAKGGSSLTKSYTLLKSIIKGSL